MKNSLKYFIVLCICHTAIPALAQKSTANKNNTQNNRTNNFCATVEKLYQGHSNHFKDFDRDIHSNLLFLHANCLVSEGDDKRLTYYAKWESIKTETVARKKFDSIKKMLVTCLKAKKYSLSVNKKPKDLPGVFETLAGYSFRSSDVKHTPVFTLEMTRSWGLDFISPDESIWDYKIELGVKEKDQPSDLKPPLKLQTKKVDSATFRKQLLELLNYSGNDFKEIKAEAIHGTTDEFQSTYKMDGAVKNVIWEIGWTYFVATFPDTRDSSEASIAFKKMEAIIKNALGTKATTKSSEEEQQMTNSISIKTKTIRFRKHDGDLTAYYVELLLVKATRKSDLLRTVNIDWTIKVTIHRVLE